MTKRICAGCGDTVTGQDEFCLECRSEIEAELKPKTLFDKLKTPGPPHVIVEARAGTGKTTTLICGLQKIRGEVPGVDVLKDPWKPELGTWRKEIEPSPQQRAVWDAMAESRGAGSVCFVAFNKSIATELQARVPKGCEAMTMHSMGFRACQAAFGKLKVDQYRVQDIIADLLGKDIRDLRKDKLETVKAVEELVGLCKMNLVGFFGGNLHTTAANANNSICWDETLTELASHYDVELNGNRREIFDLVPQVLERCKAVHVDRCVDFDDMIWLPVVRSLNLTKYDLLLVDEAQDLNRCQQQLAMAAGRRLILCGDPKQAIYGFAGADSQSMARMEDVLSRTDRGCVRLPLTVTRRCGKAIVREAQKIVPDFEAFETNPDGRVLHALYKTEQTVEVNDPSRPTTKSENAGYHRLVQDGDMCLCRVNAPLVSQCFRFLKAGRKANIQGRDIGQGLIKPLKKLKATDVVDLVAKLDDWHAKERRKEEAKRNPNEAKLIALQDKLDCLLCFTEGQETVEAVVKKIESVFTDDKTSPGIKLSSIHKAKGLEAKRVFFLMPKEGPCPHPMAKTAWAKEQEQNLLYVGITRAIEDLVYVR